MAAKKDNVQQIIFAVPQVKPLLRSRLQNSSWNFDFIIGDSEYLVAKIGVDTADNELSKVSVLLAEISKIGIEYGTVSDT